MPRFTPEQQRAIDARGRDLLVSAAAGSGKTTVLIERVLSLAAEGTDIRRILIVTFTRSAAADMRAKLESRLAALSESDARMREQMDMLPAAAIGTLHSFCAAIMRERFEAAGVDPSFRIMETAESERIRSRALREAMEEAYAAGGEGLEALVCGRDTKAVAKLAAELYAFAQNRPDPMEWLDSAVSRLSDEEHIRFLYAELEADARAAAREAISILRAALDMCFAPGGPAHYAAGIETDIEALRSAAEEGEPGALCESLGAFRPARPGRGKCEPDALNAVKALRERAAKRVKDAAGTLMPFEEARRDALLLTPCAKALADIVRGLYARVEAEKDERGAYDYADLEHRALRALRDPAVGESARAQYDYVFVDEYQDVSDAQESVIRLIAKPGSLFLVGDVKQSIYRFRHAEPGLFLEKSRRFRAGDGGELIALNRNFRSRAAILRFVNAVFERAFTGDGSEIEYTREEFLVPAASFGGEDAPVELCLIETGGEAEEAGEPESGDEAEPDGARAARAEGLFIARRVRELVGKPICDPKTGESRPMAYRDMVVLARTRARLLDIRDALDLSGVPCYADASGGLSESMEIRHALTLLRLIENRRRDADLLAALLGPGTGFEPEDIAEIRVRAPEGSLLDAALSCAGIEPDDGAAEREDGAAEREDGTAEREDGAAEQEDDAGAEEGTLSSRLRAFFHRLARWRLFSRNLPLDGFIDLLFAETGFYAYVGFLPGGARRQANLDLLCDLAAKYDSAHSDGLRGFLDSFQAGGGAADYSEASALGEGDDVVRVMTTHKSKGLEFPVVFGAQLERDFTRSQSKSELRASRDDFGMELHDPLLRTKRQTLPCRAIDSRERLETVNEELRLLYVLMTRASDRLILVGRVKSVSDAMLRWKTRAPGLRGVKTALDAIAPAVPGLSDSADANAPVALEVEREAAFALASSPVSVAEDARDSAPESALRKAFSEAFEWRYPYEEETLSPVKLTVTGLVRRAIGPVVFEKPSELPDFLGGNRAAAERGTAAHAALSSLALPPLRGLSGAQLRIALSEGLEEIADKGILTPEERAAVSIEPLARFFEGDIGARMLAAEHPKREWQFNLRAKGEEALSSGAKGADILIQGVIDCCFLEGGEWVLLDYKTDSADEAALLERYAPQLRLYRRALEEITKTRVKETWLCLLKSGRALPISR